MKRLLSFATGLTPSGIFTNGDAAVREFFRILEQVIGWVFRIFGTVWDWSFGQVVNAFNLLKHTENLPIWKMVVIAVVAVALVTLIWLIFTEVWAAVRMLLNAVVAIFAAVVANIWPVFIAGAVAFGGAWVVNNVTLPLP